MKNKTEKTLRPESGTFPITISPGMHMGAGRVRGIYLVMLSLIPLCGLMGSVFTFLTACESKGQYVLSKGFAAVTVLCFYGVFALLFALRERFPKVSRGILAVLIGGLGFFAACKFRFIVRGFQYIINGFMGAAFSKYEDTPYFFLSDVFYLEGRYYQNEYCARLTAVCVIGIMAFAACSFIIKPNVLIFVCTTFPLPELCLYFGMVPEGAFFGLLAASWCGAAAADISRLGLFSDKGAEKLFTKISAQSSFAAAVVMLISFMGASLYADAVDFKRPDSVKEIRNSVVLYMRDFSWDKFCRDVKETVFPEDKGKLTHDGKLGNTESVEFSGRNMLEVTLPSDCGGLYLKGFTGVNYTGSRWEKGNELPRLQTNLTSPEFFSARVLKRIDDFSALRSKNVIIRNTGISAGVKYYPVNAAGLLETDGVRRRYGVYFPQGDWRSVVLSRAGDTALDEDMAADELAMREYAYKYCLDVPVTFTAHEEFFKDFEGGSSAEILSFIRKGLADRCEYVLESGRKPFGADFAQWFLTDNKKGSCTHFASAAVLLCRTMGIPARYCEGFVIKEEDIKSFPAADGYTTVSVPDSRAHAWAEVYIDGYGWLSFEATPGYGNMVLELDGTEDSFEDAPVSEITSVSTEAPIFTENPAVTTGEGNIETEITVTEMEIVTTVTMSAANEESGLTDRPEATRNDDVTENAYGSAEGVGTSVSYVNNGYSDGAMGSSEISDIPETEESGSAELAPRKEVPMALTGTITFILSAAAVAAIMLLSRKLVFTARRRRLKESPDKAAAHMYRMLLALSGEENIPEELAERLKAREVPAELTETVVNAAMKARFGGGIHISEAEKAYNALQSAMDILNKDKNAFTAALLWITARDRYI
ncbi:MAG: transglutaminase family protein [Huintestinicola sp.]|uniref:transglutaminase-like domain-containing protein n=1 Tax=Huintestinicola sp. TaxID=2981661 RepID=UPI003F07C99A